MDPPLPLARMRARGELEEIRVADLRCTSDEGVQLVSGVSNMAAVPASAGERLVERTLCEQLGVSRNTLYRKLRRHGIARHALS